MSITVVISIFCLGQVGYIKAQIEFMTFFQIFFPEMSWWDSTAFSGLASQALKTAQSKIDKVLDIQDDKPGTIIELLY